VKHQLAGGEMHTPPAELTRRDWSMGLVQSGDAHMAGRNRGEARDQTGDEAVREASQDELRKLSDEDVVRLAQQGDAVAFEEIYRLHSRRVYALCLRMVGDATQAEDLTQEVFMQLFRKIGTFRCESAFTTWLHRMAVNIVLMRFRKKSIAETPLDAIMNPEEESGTEPVEFGGPDLRLNGVIDRITLQSAIQQLAPGYRAMFILHDVQGYGHSEIAKAFGCSVGNSKSQVHKARIRLRKLLLKALGGSGRQNRKSSFGCHAPTQAKFEVDYANA
jgi:RNA polymerase sigma-70 factor, ECF subfamily